jgi:hypothetical protein
MNSATKTISKNRKRQNPSVLEALGISVRASTGKSGLNVIAADQRVQRVNDFKANQTVNRQILSIPPQPTVTEQDLHKAARQALFVDLDFILEQRPELLNSPSKANEDCFGVGGTALLFAVAGDNPQVVEYLLSRGADPHLASDRGITPLHFSCRKGAIECAKLLLGHGASMFTKDRYNLTPLCILTKETCADPVMRKQRAGILSYYKSSQSEMKRKSMIGSSSQTILQLTDKVLYGR